MVLPSSGPIKFSQIQSEYGLQRPFKLSHVYAKNGAPSNGVIKLNMLKGASASAGPVYPASNLKFMLDASTLNQTDNTQVSSWSTAAQATSTNQPVFRNISDTKYVNFAVGNSSAGGDTMTIPGASLSAFNFSTGFTYIALMCLTAASQTSEGMLIRFNTSGSFGTFELFIYNDNSMSAIFYYGAHGVGISAAQYGSRNVWKLVIIRQNTTTNQLEFWINNTLIASSGSVKTMSDVSATNCVLNYGWFTGFCTGVKLRLNGLYDRSLTSTEMTDLYNSVSSIIGTNV